MFGRERLNTADGKGLENPSILVLESVYQSLSIVRSLGRAGYRPIVGNAGHSHVAANSRYVAEEWEHPRLDDAQAFYTALDSYLGRRPDIVAVFPGGERSTQLLLDYADQLTVPVVSVTPPLFDACRDKLAANQLAAEAGLQVPATALASSFEELRSCAGDIGYPVIVKPYNTKKQLDGRKALPVQSEAQLSEFFGEWPAAHKQLMIQAYIAGSLEGADFVADNGRLVAYCEATSERTDTPDGTGFGVEFRAKWPTPEVWQATRDFVATHAYNGPGLIQFLRADSTQELFFVENNPRLSAGVATSVHWGQDIPLLSLQVSVPALSETQNPSEFTPHGNPYPDDETVYWLERDIEGYLRQRRNLSAVQRRQWRRDMRASFRRAAHHVVWQADDPKPSIYVYSRLVYRWLRGRI